MTKDILLIQEFGLNKLDNSLFMGLMTYTKTAYHAAFVDGSSAPVKLAAQLNVYDGVYNRLNRAYRPVQTANETKKIRDTDAKCGKLYMAIRSFVEPITRFDFDPEQQEKALMVWNNINKYRIDINENMLSENNKEQQLVEDFETNAELAAAAEACGITSLVAKLKAAVEELRQLLTQRHDSRQEYGETKAARAAMEAEWQLLRLLTNAYALVDDDEDRFYSLITTMNRELEELRRITGRSGSSANGDGSSDDEYDGYDDGGGSSDPGTGDGGGDQTDQNDQNNSGNPDNPSSPSDPSNPDTPGGSSPDTPGGGDAGGGDSGSGGNGGGGGNTSSDGLDKD